eukprot:m51a1_g9435 hypothetical protein (587) ;mRNA; r:437998-440306
MASAQEVRDAWAEIDQALAGADADEILSQCQKLCREFSLTPSGLVHKWDSYALNMNKDPKPNVAEMAAFRSHLRVSVPQVVQRAQLPTAVAHASSSMLFDGCGYAKPPVSPPPAAAKPASQKPRVPDELDAVMDDSADSHGAASCSPQPSSQSQSQSQSSSSERPRGAVEASFGAPRPAAPRRDAPVALSVDGQTAPYRFLYSQDALFGRVAAADARTEELCNEMLAAADKDQIPADQCVQDEVVVAGRIAYEEADAPGETARLTASTAVLQSSSSIGSSRVKLAITDPEYTIFPGQAVLIEGSNPSGDLFISKKITTGTRMPFMERRSRVEGAVQILVSTGPYTMGATWQFSPLDAVIDEAIRSSPEVLILCGPFVDQQHPRIAMLTQEFQTVFEEALTRAVSRLRSQGCTAQVVVVPSLRDASYNHCVLPQPPFPTCKALQETLRAPNPCVVVVDGALSVGVTSTDVLKDLSKHSVVVGSADRMASVCRAMLRQRSWYPLCPAESGVNVDATHTKEMCWPYTPDIVVASSDLKCFVKEVDGVVFVNPGRAYQSGSYGRIARITVSQPEDGQPISTSCHVEVLRL